MSYAVVKMVWKRYPRGGSEMLLALALAGHAHENGAGIYPSVKTLAESTRQSERTVQTQLRHMREAGWLQVVARPKGGRLPTEYRIDPRWLSGAEAAPLAVQGLHPSDANEGCNPASRGVQLSSPGVQELHARGEAAAAPEQSLNLSEKEKQPQPQKKPVVVEEEQKKKGRTAIPNDFGISERVLSWAKAKGWTKDLDARLDHFLRWARSETEPASGDWDATFMQAIERDWAGLGVPIDYEKMMREMADRDAERAKWKADREREATAMALAALPPELRNVNGSTMKEAVLGLGRMGRAYAEQKLAEDLEKQRIAKSA